MVRGRIDLAVEHFARPHTLPVCTQFFSLSQLQFGFADREEFDRNGTRSKWRLY